MVRRLARIAPLVLVIEDLQWADPSTRDLLTYLVRNLHHERVLIVATARDDEPGARGDGVDLAELERGSTVERIDLTRLERDALRELLANALGGAPEPGFVDRTLARTGGNPFFAEQVVAARRETGSDDLPARLRDVVLARLASVSAAGQSVLRAASAAGRRIDDRILADVLDRPPEAVEGDLRDVIDRHILVRAGGASDPHVVFRHALLQELIHQDLLPGERARLHERYARALEAGTPEHPDRARTGPVGSAAELAYHWDEAGDRPRALAATLEAAQAAEQAYAWAEANQRYERALGLIDAEPAVGDDRGSDAAWVHVRAAETAVLIGEYEAAVEHGRAAIHIADPSVDPARVAELLERQRWYLWLAGHREAAAEALAEAERLIPSDHPSDARARILWHRAGILLTDGRFRESLPIAEEALVVARAVGSRSHEALALGILGTDLAMLGRVDEGIVRFHEGQAIAEELRGAEGIALGATNLATLLDRVGRTAEALEVAIEGWERVRALGIERAYGGTLLAVAAKAAIATGRWDEADRFLSIGLLDDPVGVAGMRLRIQRGRLATWRGDAAAAQDALSAARATDDSLGGTPDRAAILAAVAELAVERGDPAEARSAVRAGFALAATGVRDPALAALAATGLRVEADAAEAARSRHDIAAVDVARQSAAQLGSAVEAVAAATGLTSGAATGASRELASLAWCRAEAARVDDLDTPDAWLAVATGWESIDRPFPAAYARFRAAGALLRDRGDRAAATAALELAHATATRLGARPLRERIEQLARQGRLPIHRESDGVAAGPSGTAAAAVGLTERETEVLRLIAGGWSNREIADELFISRKTASVHASHIFDKLGAANRAEAAAIAHRLGLVDDPPSPPGSAAGGP